MNRREESKFSTGRPPMRIIITITLPILIFIIGCGSTTPPQDSNANSKRENATPGATGGLTTRVEYADNIRARGRKQLQQSPRTDSSASTIHDRCQKGDLVAVQAILKASPKMLHAKDDYGHTPLHRAAYSESRKLIQYLIDKGAVLEEKDSSGLTPLDRSVWYPKSRKLLLQNGAKKTIFVHVALGELEAVESFLDEAPSNIKITDGLKRTLATWAGLHGQESVLLALMKRGADPNSPDRPLVSTVRLGHKGCAELLLTYGADPQARTNYNSNAIETAILNKNDELFKILVPANLTEAERVAFVEYLILASGVGNPKTVSLLITLGVNPSSRSNQPWCAIHIASRFYQVEVIKVLLQAGIDVNARDRGGFTALDYAIDPPIYASGPVVFSSPDAARKLLKKHKAIRSGKKSTKGRQGG